MILPDDIATEAIGAKLAACVRPGDVIALSGDLGMGKTTLARGLLAALGLEGEAPSPSFAIVQPYDAGELRVPVWHVDLYRIEDVSEIRELGLDEARNDAVLLIEWPERMGVELWPDALVLRLDPEPGGGRRLSARIPPAWENRWSLT